MKTKVIITAIVCLAILEIVAMYFGINGTMLTIVVAAIAGLAGWSAPQLKLNK